MASFKDIPSPAGASDPDGDLELIAAYRQSSDLKMVAQLYHRYLQLLYGVCLKYLGEPETAKDAVMDIFEELAQKLLKHEVGNFRGWLYTLAKNHCLMKLRSAGKAKFQSFDPEHMQTAEDLHLKDKMEQEEQFERLSKCIETLVADQKTVIELFYLQNKCYKEIETATGMEWNKVRSHIQNGRRNLKNCMQRQETGKDPAVAKPPEAARP
ncbi:RNA polymerase sigma factor [Puia dinghuensis]|uniref:DNA-directed RNA polymerase sigma-70 factor n=1 Tax=Puia dinghuensis TaxID=1792502 RepID=A0A8J2XRL3_9BACT|nr:sigma-70 family RNA polymerase sigma factor [Puia dinghuensis]GGA89442.1 DNA-directed RNA polymerase sigma-70 factor [Puia dinghuensis]